MDVNSLSTEIFFKKSIANMTALQSRTEKNAAKLGAKNPYETFADMGSAGNVRVGMEVNSLIAKSEYFKRSNSIVGSRLERSIDAMDSIISLAYELRTEISTARAQIPYESAWIKAVSESKLSRAASLLNATYNEEYLFSGTAVDTKAVNDLSIPNFDKDSAGNFIFAKDTVNFSYYNGNSEKRFAKLDYDEDISYGVLAGDEAFASVIGALNIVLHNGDIKENLHLADSMLHDGADKLVSLKQQMMYEYSWVKDFQDSYSKAGIEAAKIRNKLDEENGFDVTSIVTEYQNNSVVLSAAQFLFSKISSMSILKYM